MDNRPRVVHITAHMGGGVGKVLSRITAYSAAQETSRYRHEIICLEKPEKTAFIEYARKNGVSVLIAPGTERMLECCASAAIVHFDWWHHPLMAECLVTTPWPPLRSVIWSHISGLSPPVIPPSLVTLPDKFIFSTPYSFESPYLCSLLKHEREKAAMVHSSGGFDELVNTDLATGHVFTIGYVGTLNFSKLHPQFMAFCAAAASKDARIFLVGDPTTRKTLEEQARKNGIWDQVRFPGYVDPIERALREIDVLAYLLNPEHYGTTENALLEAMASGIPPVVLDQGAEKYLVRHGETGLVVHNKKEFGEAVQYLKELPDERRRIGANAKAFVKRELSCENTVKKLHACYGMVMEYQPRSIRFSTVFGTNPAQWFLSCLGRYQGLYEEECSDYPEQQEIPAILMEPTKSSAHHFYHYFPNNERLKELVQKTENLKSVYFAK